MAEGAAPDALAGAFIAACEAELAVPKPGNVHVFAPGHGMEAQDFIASARAAAPHLAQPGARVGARIRGAIDATWAAVGQNTNLGIVLLCAPLAAAAERGGALRDETARVLAGLDIADADAAFRAIARARPAGLGSAPQHDVSAPAQTTLLEAMRAAAHRDRIAFQYAHDFVDIFETGLTTLRAARGRGFGEAFATLALYSAFLSAWPDSHIARKWGADVAAATQAEAHSFAAQLERAADAQAAFDAALVWDASLKSRGLNPGTGADLTVATLFADYLDAILASAHKND